MGKGWTSLCTLSSEFGVLRIAPVANSIAHLCARANINFAKGPLLIGCVRWLVRALVIIAGRNISAPYNILGIVTVLYSRVTSAGGI